MGSGERNRLFTSSTLPEVPAVSRSAGREEGRIPRTKPDVGLEKTHGDSFQAMPRPFAVVWLACSYALRRFPHPACPQAPPGTSLEEATQQALSSNADLQAPLADLGISQADLVTAGEVKNPQIFAQVRFPGPIRA